MHKNRNSILFLINTEKLSLLSMIQLLWIGLNDLYLIFFFLFSVDSDRPIRGESSPDP